MFIVMGCDDCDFLNDKWAAISLYNSAQFRTLPDLSVPYPCCLSRARYDASASAVMSRRPQPEYLSPMSDD